MSAYANVAVGDPIAASTINDLIAYAANRPLVRIVASGTQSIPHNTATAVTFTGTDDIDTEGYHNPASNPTRITPTRAGYYTVVGTVAMGGRADWTWIQAGISKNGTAVAPHNRDQPGANNTVRMVSASCLVSLNGTTDYVELIAQHTNGAAVAQNTNQSSQFSSVLELKFESTV